MLHEVDIVIASSGAPHYILSRDEMQRVIAARKNKPMFLIDIAVPRNIDPAVNDVEGVFLYDVDDLEGVVNANIQERSKQAEQAEAIVADEVERMMSRLKLEEVTPTIISLQEQLENIRAAEVARALRRMPALTPEQQRQVEAQMEAMTKIHRQQDRPSADLRAAPQRRAAGWRSVPRRRPQSLPPAGLTRRRDPPRNVGWLH